MQRQTPNFKSRSVSFDAAMAFVSKCPQGLERKLEGINDIALQKLVKASKDKQVPAFLRRTATRLR